MKKFKKTRELMNLDWKNMKILIPIGCRSDEGLSAPVIRRLKENPKFVVDTVKLLGIEHGLVEFGLVYNALYGAWKHGIKEKPDYILITGDRTEMYAAACAAFNSGVKIIHLYAGIVVNGATLDEISRHCITLMSDVQLCESEECKIRAEALCDLTGKKSNAHVVGVTHLDDLLIDESLVPDEPFRLYVYNPANRAREIFVGPNPDQQFNNLERSKFLGLVANTEEFITNSSSANYERTLMKKGAKIIHIGLRNKGRKIDAKPGGSDKIVEVLEKL